MTTYKLIGLGLLDEEMGSTSPTVVETVVETKTKTRKAKLKVNETVEEFKTEEPKTTPTLVKMIDELNIGRDNPTPQTNKTILLDISDQAMRKNIIHALNKRLRIIFIGGNDKLRSIQKPEFPITNSIVITDNPDELKFGYNTKVLNVNTNKIVHITSGYEKMISSNLSIDRMKRLIFMRISNIYKKETNVDNRKQFINTLGTLNLNIPQKIMEIEVRIFPQPTEDKSENKFVDANSELVKSDQFNTLSDDIMANTMIVTFPIESFPTIHTIIGKMKTISYELRPVLSRSTITQISKVLMLDNKVFIPSPAILDPNDALVKRINTINEKYELTLKYHQQYAIHNMMRSKCLIMNCDTGTGKSRMAIGGTLALDLKHVLYLTEPGVVLEVEREMTKLNFKDYKIIKDLDDKHLRRFNIMSYGTLSQGKLNGILKNTVFSAIIADECQNVRNLDTARGKMMLQLRAERYYFMSATAMANDSSDILSYILIGRDVMGLHDFTTKISSNKSSRERFIRHANDYTREPFMTMSYKTHLRLPSFEETKRNLSKGSSLETYRNRYMMIIKKSDRDLVKDESFRVRAKTMKMSVKPNAEHMNLYLEKLDAINRAHHPEQASMVSLQMITELMKVSEVPHLYIKNMKPTKKQESIVAAVDDCMERKNSIIVFTGFTESAKRLAELIAANDKKVILVTSDMGTDQRYKKIEEFRKAGKACLIGNIGLIGKGFNLEVADTVIMSDIPWSPFQYDQSIGRILRPDQKGHPEVINCLNKMMIDEYKFEVLLSKQNRIEKMLDKDSELTQDKLVHINFTEFLNSVIEKAKEEGLI